MNYCEYGKNLIGYLALVKEDHPDGFEGAKVLVAILMRWHVEGGCEDCKAALAEAEKGKGCE